MSQGIVKENTPISHLLQRNRSELDRLLQYQQDSQDKSSKAIAISESILDLNSQIPNLDSKIQALQTQIDALNDQKQDTVTQIITEVSKLARVEENIRGDSKVFKSICANLEQISEEIKVSMISYNVEVRWNPESEWSK
jgi:predicted  nucleic acid-binding Zn-ribbon protein